MFFSTFLLVGLFQFVYEILNLQLSETLEPFTDPFLDPLPEDGMKPLGWLEGLIALLMVISFIFSYIFLHPLMRVAVSWITIRDLTEKRAVTTGEALKHAWKQGLPALLTHWLAGGMILGGLAVITAFIFIPFALLGMALGDWVIPLLLSVVFVAFLSTPLLIWVTVRLSLVFPVIVEEQTRYFAALKRSWRLTRRSFWRLLTIFLLFGVILVGFTGITGALLHLILVPGVVMGWSFLWAVEMGVALLLAGLTCLMEAVFGVLATVLYFDQRIRREGLDLEQSLRSTPEAVS